MEENSIPRRARIDQMTTEELSIWNMVGQVEKLGAHPLLTDVVVLLSDARSKLADWVDLQAAEQHVQRIGLTPTQKEEVEQIIMRALRTGSV